MALVVLEKIRDHKHFYWSKRHSCDCEVNEFLVPSFVSPQTIPANMKGIFMLCSDTLLAATNFSLLGGTNKQRKLNCLKLSTLKVTGTFLFARWLSTVLKARPKIPTVTTP